MDIKVSITVGTRRSHSTPHPRLRTVLDRCRRIFGSLMPKYGVGLIILAVSTYGFTQNLIGNTIAVVLGITGFGITARGAYKTMRTYYTWPLPPVDTETLKIAESMKTSDYTLMHRKGTPGDALLTSSRVNQALFNGVDGELIVDETPFRSGHAEQISDILMRERRQKGGLLFNFKKVRLASDLLLSNQETFATTRVQLTHYFDTLNTNDALNVSVNHGIQGTRLTMGTQEFNGQDFCFPHSVVPECSLSPCSNHVGTSTIALTADGYFAIVGQSEHNAFSKKLWAPSGSGSADWPKDIRGAAEIRSLQQFIGFAAQRELLEESGLERLGPSIVAWLKIIGYGRLLHRGGLPQFFCLAKVDCTFNKLKITKPERPFIDNRKQIYFDRTQSPRQAIDAIRRELYKQDDQLSSVLWYIFELLWQMSDEDLGKAFADA